MTGNSSDVDFPIGYPQYLSPETVANWNDRRSVPKADVWSLGIILLELYLGNPFWSRSEIGPIFDSLLTLLRWQGETIAGLFIEPADVWRHKDLSKLAVNTRALHFLQGPHDGELEDNDTAQFRSFVKVCLEVDVAHRPSSEQLFSHPFFARFVFDEGVDPTLLSSWSLKPYLQSDKFEITDENFEEILKNKEITMDDETLDDTMASPLQPTRVDPLQGLPLLQIYHFWKLAGGDVESDLVKRGILLSTPVIERLPRVVKVADGKEEGGAKRDTAYLYSDATSVLSFKELHQRLEEAKRPNRNSSTESDNDHPQVVDENDINFLIDEPNEKKKVRRARQNSSRNPEINGGDAANGQINSDYDSDDSKTNDFIFTENLPNPQSGQSRPQTPLFPTTPTTPGALPSPIFGTPPIATGHFAHTLRHSNSSPSLGGISSPSSINPPSIVNTAPRPPLLIREKDVAYQFHRVTLFSELLRQYPASTREIVHHAKVDIPPLLRGKVWAVILGVTGDVEEDYNSIDKETEKPSDRQVGETGFGIQDKR
ncbi:kinase-like domain-containing protein, partial [Endogone sp. FLAS-F59071]